MKCSISGCPNFYEKRGQSISFHRFPNNPQILTAWVAATGTPNFIPTHYSKICSAHFDESAYIGMHRKLKPESVPTRLLPEDATRRILEYLKTEVNPVACILGADTLIKQVALVRDNVPPRAKSITVSMHSQPPPPTPAPASTIKVVDMKKLLQPQAQPQPTAAVKKAAESQVPVPSVSSVLNTLVSKYTFNKYASQIELSVNRTGIKASQVLTCLRIILPGKFDLSRMIPNEKVASLVIRYLKLDEKNEEIQNVVKEHLKIIIEAVKMKHKRSFEFTKHPYTKISDRDLKRALALILPEHFSMIDITDELLGLICITLNLDIYTDAYYILIRKIRKFTSEGLKFNEILNRGNKVYDDSLEVEKDVEANEVDGNASVSQVGLTESEPNLTNNDNPAGSEVDCVGEQRRELVFVDVNNPAENSQEPVDFKPSVEGWVNISPAGNQNTVESDSHSSSEAEGEKVVFKGTKRKKSNSGVDSDWEPETEKPNEMKIPEVPQLQPNFKKLKAVVMYLHEKKCSVKDVLEDYQLMFDMCRHVQIRLRNSTLKDVESKLNFIADNNINVNNVKDHLQKLSAKQFPKQPQRLIRNKRLNLLANSSDKKLKMIPVVVIQDLLDYKTGQLLFMKKEKVKSSGLYKQIPFSLKHNSSNHKYSTEQVRKLTEDSYKQFRRIILKKDGNKGVFRVKYAKLNPGTVVYAKNFRHPGVGWVKGVISRPEGPLKYQVKLDNDSLWCCTVDQLRPLLNQLVSNGESQRSHRLVKPKQLFDL